MKRTDNFLLSNLGGESVLVPMGSKVMEMNGIVTMNDTASYIWELLREECSLDDLTKAVAEQFEVDLEIARTDIQNFLDEISRMGLLRG